MFIVVVVVTVVGKLLINLEGRLGRRGKLSSSRAGLSLSKEGVLL
jgi:hypothetical protein